MESQTRLQLVHIGRWLIHRNPTYLLSACLMAVGARLLLVGRPGATGDLKVIITTLVFLQIYEWLVGAILLVLHHARRSPEDRPSLLLVAAAFWTGPLAATIEMTAIRPDLGLIVALGACLIAIGELGLCRNTLCLRLSGLGQAVGCACVVLIAGAAWFLKSPWSGSRVNELYLYAAWWMLALIALPLSRVFRHYRLPRGSAEAESCHWMQEAVFLGMTFAAASTHLVAMNYGFFCHAEYFYASPLIVAVAAIGFGMLADVRSHPGLLLAMAMLPAIAVLLAIRPFHEDVPAELLPRLLRDPAASILLLAAAVWGYGYVRHRATFLLHAASVALAWAIVRQMPRQVVATFDWDAYLVPVVGYVIATYLAVLAIWLRSRAEGAIAVATQYFSLVMLVWDKYRADDLILCLTGGWSLLALTFIAIPRPRAFWRIAPVLFLAVIPWLLDDAVEHERIVAMHSVVLIVVLLAIGQAWRWTGYRTVAGLIVMGEGIGACVRLSMRSEHSYAMILVLGGFVLLAVGALISWHKRSLLDVVIQDAAPAQPELSGT